MSDIQLREDDVVQVEVIKSLTEQDLTTPKQSPRSSAAKSLRSDGSAPSVQFNESVNSKLSIKTAEKSSRTLKSSLRQSMTSVTLLPDYAPRLRKKALPVYTKSDSSVYPSYTNLILPYRVVCRQRYQNAINQHHEQFIKEIRLHERLQPYALGGVRLRREFCDPVLVKVAQKDKIYLTLEEERRLEFILKTDPHSL